MLVSGQICFRKYVSIDLLTNKKMHPVIKLPTNPKFCRYHPTMSLFHHLSHSIFKHIGCMNDIIHENFHLALSC